MKYVLLALIKTRSMSILDLFLVARLFFKKCSNQGPAACQTTNVSADTSGHKAEASSVSAQLAIVHRRTEERRRGRDILGWTNIIRSSMHPSSRAACNDCDIMYQTRGRASVLSGYPNPGKWIKKRGADEFLF